MADTTRRVEDMDIDENAANAYTDRMSRAAGAIGMKTLASLRSLNVVILGCRGVGIETAKNLILTGPKSVTVWDREPTRVVDLGANFYLNMEHVVNGVCRGDAAQPELQGLNPYCNVDSFQGSLDDIKNVVLTSTDNPVGCLIVTEILPKADLYELNSICRSSGIIFLLALTTGVTATLFSDFGDEHSCTDPDGEPTTTFAMSMMEVVPRNALNPVRGIEEGQDMVVITIANARHGLDDGDLIEFDDMSGPLAVLNDKVVKVNRVYFKTPDDPELQKELDEDYKSMVTSNPMSKVATFLEAKQNAFPDMRMREKQMLNRFVIDLSSLEEQGISLSMDDFASWTQGGLVSQKKHVTIFNHESFEKTLESPPGRCNFSLIAPQHMNQASWEKGYSCDIHICWAAVLNFFDNEGRWPVLHNEDDVKTFYDLCQEVNASRAETEGACVASTFDWNIFGPAARDVDEVRAKRFARYFPTELTGLCAFLGGAVAQEVVKKFGKYKPITQWLHYDDQDLITDESPSNIGPLMGTRYDWQVAVLGKRFQAKVSEQKVFLVGCGALGCEYAKGLSLMGVGTASRGHVWVTDMDRIEVSNLSRQFLFRQEHVGHPKSICGAKVVSDWNPAMNITALEMFVGGKTENFFDDAFWENLDLCWNALDNVKARKYTDSRCLFFSKPLLESGTLGTKCNGEIILPFKTKSYNDGKESDDNENQIAMCTLKNFPYLPLHCIEYARQSYFGDYFEDEPQKYEQFRGDLPAFLDTIAKEGLSTRVNILRRVKRLVEAQQNGVTFEACIQIAFEQMICDYRNNIIDLTYSNPEDKLKEDGSPFWSGTKRFPSALDFSYEDVLAMEYLYCCSNMYAFVFGLDYVRDKTEFMRISQSLNLTNPEYTPKFIDTKKEEEAEEKGDGEEEEELEDAEDDVTALGNLTNWAESIDRSALTPLTAHDFEKDDDTNFHIDFMTISTNLRSFNYQIKLSTRLNVKLTAGKIIPALATTTAMVCGITELEFCKLVLGLESQGITKFKNSNINLGTATFNVFEPDEAIAFANGVPKNFTCWDKITIDVGDLTCGGLSRYLEMSFPGLQFSFMTNPAAKGNDDLNPILFDPYQAKVGQEAIESGDAIPPSARKRFPQLVMATNWLVGKTDTESNVYKRFSKMVETATAFIENGKSLASRGVYDLFCEKYGPPPAAADGSARKYLTLTLEDCYLEGEECQVPMIKYVFTH